MKTLYIARHAEAVNVGAPGVYNDFDRHLTDSALDLLARQSRGLKVLAPELAVCYSSPLVRARQTAEQLAKPYGCEVQTTEALGSSPDLNLLQHLLEDTRARTVLLVTHQPFVVQLTSWLLTGDSEVATHFGTATIACLHSHLLSPSPRGELLWMLNAEAMARVGD